MSNAPSAPNSPAAADDDAVAVSPESNVLPKGATRDEVDLHWFFNWAEADMSTSPMYSPYEMGLLGERSKVRTRVTPPEPGSHQLAAAARSSRIRRVLVTMNERLVHALARWAAPPLRIPAPVRALFGRLAGVATLTSAVDELGGIDVFVASCGRASERRDKDGAANFLRHAARVKLAVVREQAESLARDAFEAYATARALQDATTKREPASASRRALRRVETSRDDQGAALARLMAPRGGR